MEPCHAVLAGWSVAASALAFGTNAVAGYKEPVVLVHGAFEDAQIWGHVSARLKADGYQVVTVDLPGRPGDPAAPDKVSLDLYRDTVVSALGKLQRPAIVVGHSFEIGRASCRERVGKYV